MMDETRAPAALAEIRSLELEMARRLDDARRHAEADVAEATQRARRIVADADARGVQRAEAHHRERVAVATAEAERIRRAGESDAAELIEFLRPRLHDVIDQMLDVILPNQGGR